MRWEFHTIRKKGENTVSWRDPFENSRIIYTEISAKTTSENPSAISWRMLGFKKKPSGIHYEMFFGDSFRNSTWDSLRNIAKIFQKIMQLLLKFLKIFIKNALNCIKNILRVSFRKLHWYSFGVSELHSEIFWGICFAEKY